MKIKSLAIPAIAIATLVACSDSKDYKMNVIVDDASADGTMAYMKNLDNDSIIDSVTVANGSALFTGKVDAPAFVVITVNGNSMSPVILEAGETEVKDGKCTSDLNNRLVAFHDMLDAKRDSLVSIITAAAETEKEAVIEMANTHLDSISKAAMIENIQNPIGYFLALQRAMRMEANEFKELIEKYPHLTNYKRFKEVKKKFDAYEATSAGKKYSDFEIENDGVTSKLSDYVKPGQYTLVDFWASWCGPCKREIEVIKELYSKYHDKGLEVVGVAVWEDADKTQNYLNENPLPWNVMLNAQSVPTDMYGINGIPCIMLIDPEGNIVARDLFEDELVNTVAEAMGDTTEQNS